MTDDGYVVVVDGARVTNDFIRQVERASIRKFVESCADEFTGHVLDLGCGLKPYRNVIEDAGGAYHGWDRANLPANVSVDNIGDDKEPLIPYERWDAILVNQVIQYVPRPIPWLTGIRFALRRGGSLVMTGPTNWAEVESADLHRFTLAGIQQFVRDAGLTVERAERRAVIDLNGFQLSLGWGIVARR